MVDGIGSTAYMAPEFKFDKEGYNTRSEVWSVGCILMELIYSHHEMQMMLKQVRMAE